ncbi:MAG: hypothetical protein EOR97_09355 [Mesorhizobium sp.]|nr:hypothetical protein EOD00_21235 [Mesorhizobium sp. M7A.T.Ca.TU.009.01.3.1]RUV34889.1 hypothetical protein EOB49_23800 [Mesorhizobium sp. M7A.F.Ca.MR.148.00.0.0]RWN33159.1 MAG: hypothetical protein EOR97_09355 [Mesorhizobium sp.]
MPPSRTISDRSRRRAIPASRPSDLHRAGGLIQRPSASLEQFQEKCETVFRPELRQNKELERVAVS